MCIRDRHARILGDAERGTALGARCGEHACAHGVAGEHHLAFIGKRLGGMLVSLSLIHILQSYDSLALALQKIGDVILIGEAARRAGERLSLIHI